MFQGDALASFTQQIVIYSVNPHKLSTFLHDVLDFEPLEPVSGLLLEKDHMIISIIDDPVGKYTTNGKFELIFKFNDQCLFDNAVSRLAFFNHRNADYVFEEVDARSLANVKVYNCPDCLNWVLRH